MSSPLDITMVRGDSYPITFTLKNTNTKQLLPLPTGTTAKLTVTSIANPPDDTTKIFDLDGVLTDPGIAVFWPTSLQTANLLKAFYDIQLTGTDTSVRTVVKASFNIVQDRTK